VALVGTVCALVSPSVDPGETMHTSFHTGHKPASS